VSGELNASLPGGGVQFTDRADGNMSSVGGEDAEHGAQARARLRERLGLRGLARGYQVHGDIVQVVSATPAREAQTGELARADGQATAVKGVGAMVLAADCLPVAIARHGAVAMVHAGWRGMAAGVLASGVRAVRELSERHEPAGEAMAVLGPCAGPCCYEVGPEVHAALGSGHAGRGPIDLRALARRELHAAGVARVSEIPGCTICEERFFSHRREGERAGRQSGVAWLS
jgi:polyphenol oxidase